MPPQASDLSEQVRRQILQQIRTQAGDDDYDRMIAQVGEDGLLDFVLQQAGKATRQEPRKASSWWGLWDWVWLALWAYGGAGPVGGTVILAVAGGIWLIFYFFKNPEVFGSALAWTFGIALIGGIGIGLWKGGIWVLAGMRSWWGWLGGHF